MPKTTLAPKKLRQQFVAKVAALLLDLGAEASDFDFILTTKVGLLRIHPTDNRADFRFGGNRCRHLH
jgi:hypothetical protein